MSLSQQFLTSPYYPIMSCLSSLTQSNSLLHIVDNNFNLTKQNNAVYDDEKRKYKGKHRSLEFLKIEGDGPRYLFEEIHAFIEIYKETEHI